MISWRTVPNLDDICNGPKYKNTKRDAISFAFIKSDFKLIWIINTFLMPIRILRFFVINLVGSPLGGGIYIGKNRRSGDLHQLVEYHLDWSLISNATTFTPNYSLQLHSALGGGIYIRSGDLHQLVEYHLDWSLISWMEGHKDTQQMKKETQNRCFPNCFPSAIKRKCIKISS